MEQLYISYSPTILSVQAFEEYKLLYASSNSGKVQESMLATVRAVMDSEMIPFLETMRMADVSVIQRAVGPDHHSDDRKLLGDL